LVTAVSVVLDGGAAAVTERAAACALPEAAPIDRRLLKPWLERAEIIQGPWRDMRARLAIKESLGTQGGVVA